MTRWTAADIPSQNGRSAVVTGTGGIGFEDALALARAGSDVIIAGRNRAKGDEAVARIRRAVPPARVRFEALDLASLASVAAFGRRLADTQDGLDLLINNAAVMAVPRRQETGDGLELQMATNYFGHFALTGHLLPLLRRAKGSRVVSLSSVAARNGAIDLQDLQATRAYRPMAVYSQSKLACLLFAFELQRRSTAANWGVTSLAAHPGIARTELIPNSAGHFSASGALRFVLGPVLFQPPAQAALPTLFAATSPAARGGAYYGPDRMGETRGLPALARVPPRAADADMAARLWDASERLTGVVFPAEPIRTASGSQLAEATPMATAR